MKVTLLDVNPRKTRNACINKDLAGSFGTASIYGRSLFLRGAMRVKQWGIKLPLISFGYMASILRNNGHQVEVMSDKIPQSDLVIIHSSIVGYKTEVNMARMIRKSTKAKVGFIGAFASVMPEIFLNEADFVIRGDPEEATSRLSDQWVPRGEVASRPLQNLDSLPFPDWSLFAVKEYSYFPLLRDKPFLSILSSRGCGISCSYYCPYTVSGNDQWRARGSDSVIREIQYLVNNFKIRGLLFRDPLFTFDRGRVERIASGIVSSGINIEWGCESRLDYLDESLLDIMYRSGLRLINFGIESQDNAILAGAKRPSLKKEFIKRILSFCRKKRIITNAFYILGFPGDSQESIKKTINYAIELNADFAQFTILTPYPGTSFFQDTKKDIFEQDWEKFDGYSPVFRHKNIPSDRLLQLKEQAFIKYYCRLPWMLKFLKGFIC